MSFPSAFIEYLSPTRVEVDCVAGLRSALERNGIAHALVVTDRGIERCGLLATALAHLPPGARMAMFADTPQNPTEDAVDAGADVYRSEGCDGVVAIGGGSSLDLAKAIALRVSHDGPLADYAAAIARRTIGPGVPAMIAIPTTAGSGSEVGRASLIVMRDGIKRALVSKYLLPRESLCDPALTVGLPAHLTAGTGMDAISHCVEAFLSPRDNPPADAIALDGLTRGMANLKNAVERPDDLSARWHMMMTSLEGGLCFPKGLGGVHALSHALATVGEGPRHHGTLNAILLPAWLAHVAPLEPEKVRRLSAAAGVRDPDELPSRITLLMNDVRLPTRLGQIGVNSHDIDAAAEGACADFSHLTAPGAPTAETYRMILNAAA